MLEKSITSEKIKNIPSQIATILHDASETCRDDHSLLLKLGQSIHHWAKDAERDCAVYEQQQQTLQQQRQFYEMSTSLKLMLAYALNCMPSHFDFWGNISPHSIHLSFSHGIFSFRLIHSRDAHDMPLHFHQTASELQQILDNIHIQALTVLNGAYQNIIDKYLQQRALHMMWGISPKKTVEEFGNDYNVTYLANNSYLFKISSVTMTPVFDGVNVSFTAAFDDHGLSPENFWFYILSI